MAGANVEAGPRTFLFADLRGYTAYVEAHGDRSAAALLARYRDIVRAAVAEHGGAEVKTEGDSFYVVFGSSVAAVRCAMAIQQEAAADGRSGLDIGIGLHAGETIAFERQYVGSAVNVAARLAASASAGEILVSETVRGLIRTALPIALDNRGPLVLKGIDEPIRTYSWRAAPPAKSAPVHGARSALDAIRRGELARAMELASAAQRDAPPDDRCDILAAVSLVAAARGDLEGALGRTEKLLGAALRASDGSWIRAAYGLRAWLYFLARQPGEARAELDRSFDRPGGGPTTALPLLLAVSLGGTPGHVERLRHMGGTTLESALAAACGAIVDVLQARIEPAAAREAVQEVAGPFLGAVLELQLTARRNGELGLAARQALARSQAQRLAELISRAAAQ